jgi:putative peptidoglycan lipid II flippase
LTAFFLGSSYLSQAFLIALRLPNTFREMFAEGAFASSFIPTLSKLDTKAEKRKQFLNDSFSFLVITLIILTILFMIFMPTVVSIIAPGFEGEKFDVTVHLSRIMFPYLLFISITTFFASILQNSKKFFIPALAPIIFNIILIISIFAFKDFLPNVALSLSYGVFISGIIQIIFMYYFVRKLRVAIRMKIPKLTPEAKDFLRKFFPAFCGSGVYYLNILVGSIFSSYFEGAVSWIYFAQRIYMLPIGIIGAAIATVLLPHLSTNLQTKNQKEKHFLQNNSFLLNLLLGIPCMSAMLLMSVEMVGVLFQHGSFNLNDTMQTAAVLKILSLNVVIILFNRVFANMFFARNDTKTPALLALISFTINFICLYFFTKYMGFIGIPHATVISAIVPFVIYVALVCIKKYVRFDTLIWKKIAFILIANIALGAIFYFINQTNLMVIARLLLSGIIGLLYLIQSSYFVFKKSFTKS